VTLRILAEAKWEIIEASEWYDARQPGLGDAFRQAVSQAMPRIRGQPQSYPRLETYRTRRIVRRYLLKRFPFSIIYELRPTEIVVLAVAHVRRRPNYWKRRS
jgi:hypothetical protein